MTAMHLSGKHTVGFIANLLPIFTFDQVNDLNAARSLQDGTLIRPLVVDEPCDEFVEVWWQGDSGRSTHVMTDLIASRAVVDFVRFHSVGKDPDYSKQLLDHLREHYEHKTSRSLYLPYADDGQSVGGNIIKGAKRYWPDAVWEILKKGVLG
jgi:hypothetical protein